MCCTSSVTLAAERQSDAIHYRGEQSVKQNHKGRNKTIQTSHAFLCLAKPQDLRERPKQSACHDRAERNDPYAGHLLENEEVAIRTQASATVEEQELLAVKEFVGRNRKKEKRREDKKDEGKKVKFFILKISQIINF